MTSIMTSSMIERSPRAPVLRLIALVAIASRAAIPPHQRAIEETFSVLTPEEQAQLVELLKKFKNV